MDNKDFIINIITRGRTNNQLTLQSLHPDLLNRVILWCHPGEINELSKAWGDKVMEIYEYDSTCTHVGEVREYVVHNCPVNEVILCDDNVFFSKSILPKKNIRKLSLKNFYDREIYDAQVRMFNFLSRNLHKRDIAITSLSFRGFANFYKETELSYNRRFFAVFGIDRCKYLDRRNRVHFLDWPLKEDFAVGVSLVRLGYDILINNYYQFDKIPNQDGGCKNYRNQELLNETSRRLSELFPEAIKLREEKRDRYTEAGLGNSYDIKIDWTKLRKGLRR